VDNLLLLLVLKVGVLVVFEDLEEPDVGEFIVDGGDAFPTFLSDGLTF